MSYYDQTRGFGGFITDAFETVTDIVPYAGTATNELGDFLGDATDFVQNPSAGDFLEIGVPAVAEDVFDGGGLDDLGGLLPGPLEDVVDGNGFNIPLVGTVGPNAPNSGASAPPVGTCPPGFQPNPSFISANLNGGAALRSGPPPPRCVPTNNNTGQQTPQQGQQGNPTVIPDDQKPAADSNLDENCKEKPKEYPAPSGCIPGVATEHTFFREQKQGCVAEWKKLEAMEAELKARYEQLCMAREKYNQRTERYGDMCGPYELLYGIEEAKDKLAKEKAKAKKECLDKKKGKNCCGSCATGGSCGCSGNKPSGCGCSGNKPSGCAGAATHGAEDMEVEEYKDPVKKSCKRAVEESFSSSKKKKTVKPKKRTPTRRSLRKPKNTVITLPTCGKRKRGS
jgi:hypothetical protein